MNKKLLKWLAILPFLASPVLGDVVHTNSAWTSGTGGMNLPVADTVAIVTGSVDTTKKIRFEVDGLTTATTRVITPPNADTSLPIITQTLTISGPTAARTLTIPDANATMARTDAGQTFTGTNNFGLTTFNTPTLTATAGIELKGGGYRQAFTIESNGSATDRVWLYLGDGTNSTLTDEWYEDFNNTVLHMRLGSSGTTEIVTISGGAGAQGIYLGAGVTSTAPQSYALRGTGGSGSNIAGSNLGIQAGIGTGSAVPALVKIQSTNVGGGSGTGAQTVIDRETIGASKILSNNSTTTVVNVTDASDTVAAVLIHYAVEVNDGASHHQQVEAGMVSCVVTNANGAFAGNTCTKFGNTQSISASGGTLTVTWTITAANPALIQINSNTGTITPAAGFPRVTYNLINLTQQAVAIQ